MLRIILLFLAAVMLAGCATGKSADADIRDRAGKAFDNLEMQRK